jgi:hypothetical protein
MPDTEEVVARVLRETTALEAPPDRNFFEAGLNSATAVAFHECLQLEFGRAFPVTDVFKHPTVRRLAAHLDERSGTARAADAAPRPAPPTWTAQARKDLRTRMAKARHAPRD